MSEKKNVIEILNGFHDKKKKGLCPFCGLEASKMEFRDDLSKKEFEISGLCQKCQDETFEED